MPHETCNRAPVTGALGIALLLVLAGASPVQPSFAHETLERNIARVDAEIERAPDDAALYLRRSELRRVHREWEPALDDLRRAVALAPALVELDYYLALTLVEAGRPDDALAAIDRYLLRGPDRAAARLVRSRALSGLGRTPEAVRDLDRAIELHPSPQTYLTRADLLAAAGDLDRAIAGLDEGVERLGDVPALIERAVSIELGRGDRIAALARLDAVLARGSARGYWRARRADIDGSPEPTALHEPSFEKQP